MIRKNTSTPLLEETQIILSGVPNDLRSDDWRDNREDMINALECTEYNVGKAETEYNVLVSALKAIRARICGEWDNPSLMAIGPLSVNDSTDTLRIADAAICEVEQ